MTMFIISKVAFTLLVNLDLLFQSFLCVCPNLGILFFKCFSFFIDLGKLLFDFDHKLLVSNNHHISEKDELVVVVEDVVYVFNWFLFKNFRLNFSPESVQISFEYFVCSLSYFYLLLSVLVSNEFSEKLFECIFCVLSGVLHIDHIFFSAF